MPEIPKSNRLISIDYFRGQAIILMVLSNYSVGVIAVPSWLKHAQDIGLTINDLIAPIFIFAIGLTYGLSVRTRSECTSRGYAPPWLVILEMVILLVVLSWFAWTFDCKNWY